MSHQIIKHRSHPITVRPIAPAPIQAVLVERETDWGAIVEKIYIRSVITFWVILMTCGAIGIGAITIFGVIQLARNSTEVVD